MYHLYYASKWTSPSWIRRCEGPKRIFSHNKRFFWWIWVHARCNSRPPTVNKGARHKSGGWFQDRSLLLHFIRQAKQQQSVDCCDQFGCVGTRAPPPREGTCCPSLHTLVAFTNMAVHGSQNLETLMLYCKLSSSLYILHIHIHFFSLKNKWSDIRYCMQSVHTGGLKQTCVNTLKKKFPWSRAELQMVDSHEQQVRRQCYY